MSEARAKLLDEVIEDLRRVLAKCDEAGVCSTAAIHIDLAMHLAMRERDPELVEAA